MKRRYKKGKPHLWPIWKRLDYLNVHISCAMQLQEIRRRLDPMHSQIVYEQSTKTNKNEMGLT